MIEMSKKKKNSTMSLIAIAGMAAAVSLIAATTLIPTQALAGGHNDDHFRHYYKNYYQHKYCFNDNNHNHHDYCFNYNYYKHHDDNHHN